MRLNEIYRKLHTAWDRIRKKEKQSRALRCKHYVWGYTALFTLLSFAVFVYFIRHDKTFVKFMDGWAQHYKALEYYGQWLRSIVKS